MGDGQAVLSPVEGTGHPFATATRELQAGAHAGFAWPGIAQQHGVRLSGRPETPSQSHDIPFQIGGAGQPLMKVVLDCSSDHHPYPVPYRPLP